MTARAGILTAALAVAALAAGCASGPQPTQEVARARTLIDQAEQSGAQQFAAADLERARTKLSGADDAVEQGEMEQARRLALEAAVDAELASAKASTGKVQRAAQELEQSVETLRSETERGSQGRQPQQ